MALRPNTRRISQGIMTVRRTVMNRSWGEGEAAGGRRLKKGIFVQEGAKGNTYMEGDGGEWGVGMGMVG